MYSFKGSYLEDFSIFCRGYFSCSYQYILNIRVCCFAEEPQLEESPKWQALTEVLEEIKDLNKQDTNPGRVVIAAQDDKTCAQLKEVCSGNAWPPN